MGGGIEGHGEGSREVRTAHKGKARKARSGEYFEDSIREEKNDSWYLI